MYLRELEYIMKVLNKNKLGDITIKQFGRGDENNEKNN